MSDTTVMQAFRLTPDHIEKLRRDADELGRVTGTRPQVVAALRAAIEYFNVSDYIEFTRTRANRPDAA